MELTIYDRQGIAKLTVSPDSSSQWNHEIGVENVVSVNFTTWEFIVMEVGWYIVLEGQTFKIKKEYRPKHIHNTKFTYNLKFYGREHDTEDILFCRLNQREDDYESIFAYDGTPMEFLQKVVDNMNRNSDGIVWKVGEAIDSVRKTINFNGLYCWDALGEISRVFETEWWIDGDYINMSKCIRGESSVLGYGIGLRTGLTQTENTNSIKWFTRLIPIGSTRNIDKNKYGYNRLQLPGREQYIDVNVQFGLKEYREESAFTEIYPHRIGTVSSVRTEEKNNEETGNYTVYYVKDDDLPFNPEEYMISGEVINITFNTGDLAGKEFEVNWNSSTKEFEIINQYPDDSSQLPGGNLIPSEGNTYVLTNIRMPDEYIIAAEQEFLEAVTAYLAEYSNDISIYSGNTDYIYIEKNNVPLLIGQRITLISDQYFATGSRETRITRVSRKLNNINDASIDCCDAITSSWKSEVDSSLNQLQFSVAQELAKTVVQILKTGDSTLPSEYNVFSAVRGLNTFLNKNINDRSKGYIASDKGFEAGTFISGSTGVAVYQDEQGNWHIETDNLKIRKKLQAAEVEIQTAGYIGGQQMLSAAHLKIDYVYESESYCRCYFRKKDSDGNIINNQWKINDQAYCNTFNLETQADGTTGNHFYWRLVIATSNETSDDVEYRILDNETIATTDFHFIDLSKEICASASAIPKRDDKVVHLGYRGNDDIDRQNAIIIAGSGSGSPYIQLFTGINAFALPEPEQIKPGDNRLSAILEVKGGSTGWKNFDGLPEEIQSAIRKAEEVESSIKDLEYGKNNLLRNSGFTGDYLTASLQDSTALDNTSQMFSPSLKYWEGVNATAQESEISESSKEVTILAGGSLQQTMFYKVIAGEKYIFSFRGKGLGSVTFSVGGYTNKITLTEEWKQFVEKFTTVSEGQIFSINVSGDCSLCELQLERGTVKSAWGMSPLDNRSELAKYESLSYLTSLLKATTSIIGGVINTGYINMGNLDSDGNLSETTAGVSGVYNDDQSVAFFAGGNLERAIYTVSSYIDNPNYQPTEDELKNMAKFVCTHGGRAILNDVILRGYIYALGGFFKGEVNAVKGVFKNVKSPNGNFEIDDDGNVKITGTFETNLDGQRIKIDSDNKEIVLYDELNRETAKMGFLGDTGENWTYGYIVLKRYNGDSDEIIYEANIYPNLIRMYDNNPTMPIYSELSPEGFSCNSQEDSSKSFRAGLRKIYDGVTLTDIKPFVDTHEYRCNSQSGYTGSISIKGNNASHTLTFSSGILTEYNREDYDTGN